MWRGCRGHQRTFSWLQKTTLICTTRSIDEVVLWLVFVVVVMFWLIVRVYIHVCVRARVRVVT
jgi:hypothetical protein